MNILSECDQIIRRQPTGVSGRYTGSKSLTTQFQSPPLTLQDRAESSLKGNVRRHEIQLPDKKLTLFELPRVDLASLDALQNQLSAHNFDAVAVELDEQRRVWLTDKEAWQNLNLLDILRQKKGRLLSAYLAMRIFQKRFGSFDGCEPGDDSFVAIEFAEKYDLPLALIDRDMQITALRAWRKTPTLRRPRLAMAMTAGVYRRTRPREDAEDEQQRDDKLGKIRRSMPVAANAFLDERHIYMARRLRELDGKNIAVVLSSVHAEKVATLLQAHEEPPLSDPDLDQLPERKLLARLMPWLLTILILGLFVFGFAFGDPAALKEAMLIWAILHVTCTAFFSVLTLAHPGAIAAAALASPFVSLNPALSSGLIGALAQAFLSPPSIAHIERIGDDITRLSGWWTNQLGRLMLLFIAANLGSTIGTVTALAFFPNIFS